MALAAEIKPGEEQDNTAGPAFNRPVDLVHLARYTLGSRPLEREVLKLFHSQSVLYLQRLKDAGADKDWADAAHTIKGSAKGIGAWQVARCAEAAEGLCGKSRESGSVAVLRELEWAISEANGYIETLLAEAGPEAV